MAEKRQLEFFLLRYVPDAVKDEFVNIGLIMLEPGVNGAGFAEVRFTRDWRRVRCLDPQADVEILEALEQDIRAHLQDERDREAVLRKLEESFSNLIQLSPRKACLAAEPAKEIETLARLYLEAPKPAAVRLASGRQQILRGMRAGFEQAGIWRLLTHGIPVDVYTKPGDPFKFDFGYRVGNAIKILHAVSLKTSVDQAVTLAARYPAIASGMTQKMNASPFLTAVVDDRLDRGDRQVQFALDMMEDAQVQIAALGEIPKIAEAARRELRA